MLKIVIEFILGVMCGIVGSQIILDKLHPTTDLGKLSAFVLAFVMASILYKIVKLSLIMIIRS